jgi:hypothetical protein
MIKTSVLRYAAIGMATISMAGFAAASTVNFDTTGPDSNQEVVLHNSNRVSTHNDNSVGVANFNAQEAESGNVSAYKNTSVGGAVRSGDASNNNSTHTDVTVSNSGAGALGSWGPADTNVNMHLTGPDSNNEVRVNNNNSVRTTNDNDVRVVNLNLQSAESGRVSASKNTTVGDLSSGDASNHNSTTTSVSIHN